jgi:hypothetical protein
LKILILSCVAFLLHAQEAPAPENLSYRIEWRMVTAGEAKLEFSRSQPNWMINLKLESAGLVSRLFRVEDSYKVTSNEKFCAINTTFDAQEGKRHTLSLQQFDNSRHKLNFDERDLVKNTSERHEMDIAPCTYEILGALAALREFHLEPGKSVTLPIANGKKMAYAKIEAQAKESVTVDGKSYPAMRYEAFIFDGILFRKKGRAFVWLTDDAERMPVQMRFQMGFPIGNITLELEKMAKP